MRFLFLLLLANLAWPAQAKDWQVDYAKSRVGFVIKQMNVPVEGEFRRFTVQADFDPLKPETGHFRVEVEVASIATGAEDGDNEAQRPAWFDAAHHPKASFVSRSVRKEAGYYVATGDMSVKGNTRPLAVAFVLRPQRDGGWVATGRFPLKRSDFALGGGDWADVVAEDAEVKFSLVLQP